MPTTKIIMVPVVMYVDNDFMCEYKVLLNVVKTLIKVPVVDYYLFPTEITKYLIDNGYATVGHTSLYKSSRTLEFLNVLRQMN